MGLSPVGPPMPFSLWVGLAAEAGLGWSRKFLACGTPGMELLRLVSVAVPAHLCRGHAAWHCVGTVPLQLEPGTAPSAE